MAVLLLLLLLFVTAGAVSFFNNIVLQSFIKKRKMLNMLFPHSESCLLLFHNFLPFHRMMNGS